MQTPPSAPGSPLPPTLRSGDQGVYARIDFTAGDTIATFQGNRWVPLGDMHVPRGAARLAAPCYVNLDNEYGPPMYIPRPSALPNALLRQHPLSAAVANCEITCMDLVARRDICAGSLLVLTLTAGTVMGQDIPPVIAAASDVICPDFLKGRVPRDSGAGTDVALIDGYLTMESMARLVTMSQHCLGCAVIGCGYGEVAALMATSRQCSVLVFETVDERREAAQRLFGHLGLGGRIATHGTLADYDAPYPPSPLLIWTNNLRYNDARGSIPGDLIAGVHFPTDGTILATMLPFRGELNIYVCTCGTCHNGCSYGADTESIYMVAGTDDARCGTVRGFVRPDRIVMRLPPVEPPVILEPYGAGAGRYPVVRYLLQRCTERLPTPQADLVYTTEIMESGTDLTPRLRHALGFASEWLGGDLLDESMVFHGSKDAQGREELLGIDCAVVFLVQEPGDDPVVYGYRTIGRVRDCGLKGVLRINHDIMRLQGRSFINQANLQLASVVRSKFPDATGIVIEPDRDVEYHRNYEKGFYWRIEETLPPRKMSDVVPHRSYRRYRDQIQLDPLRYVTYYFDVPRAGTKRPRVG